MKMKKIIFFLALFFYINAQSSPSLDDENIFLPEDNKAPILGDIDNKDRPNQESESILLKEINGLLDSDAKTPISLFEKKEDAPTDYSYCKKYYNDASVKIGNLRAIKITLGSKSDGKNPTDGIFIGFSKTHPKVGNIAKYDPFTGLFMLKNAKAKFSYTLMDIDDYAETREIVSVDGKNLNKGRLQASQKGFIDYAIFSNAVPENSVISNICYQIYGLGVGDKHFIEKEYIDRFVSQKNISYGDIGVRFKLKDESHASFIVEFVDPFFDNNQFKKGDELVAINEAAPKDTKQLQLLLANLQIDSTINVKIRRDDTLKEFKIKVGKMYGGYLQPDSFLERFNMLLDNQFRVQKVATSGPLSSLKVGDKLISFNNIELSKYKPKTTKEKNRDLKEIFTMLQDKRLEILDKRALSQKEEDKKVQTKETKDSHNLIDGSNLGNKNFVQPEDFDKFAGTYKDKKTVNKDFELLGEKDARTSDEIIQKSATDVLIDKLKNPESVELSVRRGGNIIKLQLFDK